MSGGSFDYVYSRVEQFAEDLTARLRAAAELRPSEPDGPDVFNLETTAVLERIAAIAVETAALMNQVEKLYSGDNGEEHFVRNVRDLGLASMADVKTRVRGPEPDNMVTIKRSAVDCSNHLALLSEKLLEAVDSVHVAEEEEDEAGMEEALEARSEYSSAVRSAIYEYRKRLPKDLMDAATIDALTR